jgi:small neutral amino acid transporter SnatA (MarC family)
MAAMADALSTLGASFITFFAFANPIGSALIFDRAVVDLSRAPPLALPKSEAQRVLTGWV